MQTEDIEIFEPDDVKPRFQREMPTSWQDCKRYLLDNKPALLGSVRTAGAVAGAVIASIGVTAFINRIKG